MIFGGTWRSMIPDHEIDDVKRDKKKAAAIEQYMVSEKAIYVKGEYLPISCIQDTHMQESTYAPNCCCGKGIPVYKIRIDYGGKQPLVLMLEKEKNARKLMSVISAGA